MLAEKGEQSEQRLPPKARSAVRQSNLPCRSEFALLLRLLMHREIGPGAIDEALEFMQITADEGVGQCRRMTPFRRAVDGG